MAKFLENEALLICTKDRYAILEELAFSLSKCSFLPEFLVFVDASHPQNPEFINKSFSFFGQKLSVISSKAHLPFQRNLGIKSLPKSINIIHFIDDDFLPNSDYFSHLSAFLKSKNSALGVGGKIEPISKSNPNWISSLFLLETKQAGILLKSGRTTEPQATENGVISYPTQFLSGCSMSFKSHIFSSFLFDETLEAYAQDEDLAFCLQLPENTLFVEPKAIGFHKKSTLSRLNPRFYKKMVILNRWIVLQNYAKARIHPLAFFWSCLGQILIMSRNPNKNKELIFGVFDALNHILKTK